MDQPTKAEQVLADHLYRRFRPQPRDHGRLGGVRPAGVAQRNGMIAKLACGGEQGLALS